MPLKQYTFTQKNRGVVGVVTICCCKCSFPQWTQSVYILKAYRLPSDIDYKSFQGDNPPSPPLKSLSLSLSLFFSPSLSVCLSLSLLPPSVSTSPSLLPSLPRTSPLSPSSYFNVSPYKISCRSVQ